MMKLLTILFFLLYQDTVPFKPNEEFDLKLDYQFKERLITREKVGLTYSEKEHYGTGPLPHLEILVTILEAGDDEKKLRVSNNQGQRILNKKVQVGMDVKINIGFLDDVKDGVSANQYTLEFLSESKTVISNIIIRIEKNGDFFVNNEKRGRF